MGVAGEFGYRLEINLRVTGFPSKETGAVLADLAFFLIGFRRQCSLLGAQTVHFAFKKRPASGVKTVSSTSNCVVLSVDDEEVGAKSRLVHIALLNLNLRFMENWRSVQMAAAGSVLDYESLMILMAIIVIVGERILRAELEPELQSLERLLPPERVGKANFSSIAAATGINRETVRRKVNKLQKAGWLVRDKEGIRTVPGVIPYEDLRGIIGAQLDALTRTVNQLTRLGVLPAKCREV